MNTHTQIVYMQSYTKKILLSFLIIFVSFLFLFFGTNQIEQHLASLWGVITAWVTINPLEVDVSAPSEVEVNKVFKVRAELINKGEEKIENAKGEIFLPADGLVLLRKDPVQKIGVIPDKKEKKISWSVKGEEVGNYIITVSASGELRGYGISAEDSIKVAVKESLRGTQLQEWFQNLFDFFQERFGY